MQGQTIQWQKNENNDLQNTTKKIYEEVEDSKGVFIIRKSKDIYHNDQTKKTKGQTTIYKTLHRKLKIDQHEPY